MRILRALKTHGSMSARDLEDKFGGVKGELRLPKQRVRDMVKVGLKNGVLGGGERKPLVVTSLGDDFLRQTPPAEDAMRDQKTPPRKKSQ